MGPPSKHKPQRGESYCRPVGALAICTSSPGAHAPGYVLPPRCGLKRRAQMHKLPRIRATPQADSGLRPCKNHGSALCGFFGLIRGLEDIDDLSDVTAGAIGVGIEADVDDAV